MLTLLKDISLFCPSCHEKKDLLIARAKIFRILPAAAQGLP
jgi:hypothetical protein